MNAEFGKYLRNLRKGKGLSLVETAEKAGLSHSYLSQIERAERGVKGIPAPEVLRKLSEPLETPYLDLMVEAGYITEQEIINAFIDADFTTDDNEVYSQLIENREKELRDLKVLLDGSHVAYFNGNVLEKDECKRILNILNELFPKYASKKR